MTPARSWWVACVDYSKRVLSPWHGCGNPRRKSGVPQNRFIIFFACSTGPNTRIRVAYGLLRQNDPFPLKGPPPPNFDPEIFSRGDPFASKSGPDPKF